MADTVNVRIEITGLALCFLREEVLGEGPIWNIAFLCDAHHTLDLFLNDNNNPERDWRTTGEDIFLDVEHSDNRPCRGNDFRKMLNISSPVYGHGVNPNNSSRSNLQIIDRNSTTTPITTELVWMRVPHAKLDTGNHEDTKMMRILPHHGVPKRVADRAKEVYLSFEVNADFHLVSRNRSGAETKRKGISLTDDADGRITLRLNNGCLGAACERNDFVDLYEFVQDHRKDDDGSDVEFRYISWAEDAETEIVGIEESSGIAAKRLRTRLRDGWVVVDEKDYGDVEIQKEYFRRLREEKVRSPYGNCDPVSSEPPPGP